MELTTADRQVAANLDTAKRATGRTNAQIAEALGRPGDTGMKWVQERLSGKRGMTYGLIVDIADIIGVPLYALTAGPDEVYAYIAAHPELTEHLVVSASPWTLIHAA